MGDRSQNPAGMTSEPTAPVIRDFSRKLSALRSADGTEYRRFRAALKPRYLVVWRDIGIGYAVLMALVAGAIWLPISNILGVLISAILFGAALGYCIHYLSLFFHAASHYNLAANGSWNDRLATAFLGLWFGYDIQSYRAIHFGHHTHLGTAKDPESSYIERLDVPFFVAALTGLRFLRKLTGSKLTSAASGPSSGVSFPGFRLFSLAVHLALVSASALSGEWILALAWLGAWIIVFPLLTDLRLMLEHRLDPIQVPDSGSSWMATSRIFTPGLLSATFGAAGFDRHLLHHLDPSVPYERLGEFEEFLKRTDKGAALVAVRDTYPRTFAALFGR